MCAVNYYQDIVMMSLITKENNNWVLINWNIIIVIDKECIDISVLSNDILRSNCF